MCPVPVLVLQRVMEKVVKDTVPDGQCAPFEFCCFWCVWFWQPMETKIVEWSMVQSKFGWAFCSFSSPTVVASRAKHVGLRRTLDLLHAYRSTFLGASDWIRRLSNSVVSLSHCIAKWCNVRVSKFDWFIWWLGDQGDRCEYLSTQHCHVWGNTCYRMHCHAVSWHDCMQIWWPIILMIGAWEVTFWHYGHVNRSFYLLTY